MPIPITPIESGPAVPESALDEPIFDDQQEAFYAWEKNKLAPGVSALAQATYQNAVEAAASSTAATAASVLTNFAGKWSDLSGELLKGAGVFDGGRFWVLLNDLADVTLSRPGVTADWVAPEGYFSPGDVLTTARPVAAPQWLLADGAVYSKAVYPALGAVMSSFGQEVTEPPTHVLPDPAEPPAGLAYDVAFSPDGTYMAVTHNTAPYVTIYKRSGDVFTKLPNPATLPVEAAYGAAFSADGTYLAVAHALAPFVTVYKRAGDVFTKLADPASLPTGAALDVAFSADGTYLAVAHGTTPFVTIYKRAGDVFTKLANPSVLPTGQAYGVAFSADGTYLAVAHDVTPFVTIYKRAGDVFTKLTNPSTLPVGQAAGLSFSPDGTYLAVAHVTTPFVTIYKRAGDVFTKLANPAVLPAGQAYGAAFSPDGTYLAVSHNTAPFVTIYKRAADVFTKEPDLSPTPGTARGLAYFKGATKLNYLLGIAVTGAPYVRVYRDAYAYDPRTEFPVPTIAAPAGLPFKTYIRA